MPSNATDVSIAVLHEKMNALTNSFIDDRERRKVDDEAFRGLFLEKIETVQNDLTEVKSKVQNHHDMLNRGKGAYSALVTIGAILTWFVGVPIVFLKYLGFKVIS